ncbi:hypothetical protein DFR29_11599 [Tahibacter aquaticus]|uniref:Uncharacterized protein n=2 Tax=Tahibacter aquaticus TaxID=520092 RepID=A0A4R6YQ06_9GAMM|nr:hypothetical protein DFR29_11599 [Tahibacter aquaticus]
MKMTALRICLVVGLCAAVQALAAQWPGVGEVHARFAVTEKYPHVGLVIPAADGEPLYRLSCHQGDYESKVEGDFDHMFHCKLFDMRGVIRGDMFSPTPEWNRSRTRATFRREQLMGRCASHAYFGKDRTFRMMGMNLRMAISDLRQPDMRKMLSGEAAPDFAFNFQVDVRADATATNEFVGPAPEMCTSYYKVDESGKLVEIATVSDDEATPDTP